MNSKHDEDNAKCVRWNSAQSWPLSPLLSGENRGIWISPQNVQYRSLKQALRNGFVDANQVGAQYVPYVGSSWGWNLLVILWLFCVQVFAKRTLLPLLVLVLILILGPILLEFAKTYWTSQKQVRNSSETVQKHQKACRSLPSQHIHHFFIQLVGGSCSGVQRTAGEVSALSGTSWGRTSRWRSSSLRCYSGRCW